MRLELSRGTVRPLRESDAESLARHADNRAIWRNLRDLFPHPYRTEHAREFIARVSAAEPQTCFAIEVAGQAAGVIGFDLHRDVERVSAEIGYWLGEPYWGRGIMTEVLGAVTARAIEAHGLTRVYAVPYAWSLGSCRVLEKAGYELEGRLRRSAIKDGRVVDQWLYARVPGADAPVIRYRAMAREEIERIWTIDRSETIRGFYELREGRLVLKPELYEARGWPPGEAQKYTPRLVACFERGGWFVGAYDGERLCGCAVLDTPRLGPERDLLLLDMLHVSRAYRGRGIGTALFERARRLVRQAGARGLYISATPSEHTIGFYTGFGATPIGVPDPELLALEPDDIHLVCPL